MGLFDNSFTHWLGDRTGIHSMKPIAKIAATVGGGALGGPMGAGLGAGLFDFGDDMIHGKGFGNALKDGAISGGLTYGGAKALGALQNAFSPGSGAGASVGGSAAQGAPEAGSGAFGGLGDAAKEAAIGQGAGPSLMDRLGSGIGSVGSFAAKNPTAVGMGLQGLGAMQSAGSENALRNAQAAQLQAQTQAQEEENAAKKQRAAAMEPLLRALMGGSGIKVAPNPYL